MNLTENVVAIDPGKNGGIASCINGDVEAVKMPDSAVGIMEFLNKQREKAPDLIVYRAGAGFPGRYQNQREAIWD